MFIFPGKCSHFPEFPESFSDGRLEVAPVDEDGFPLLQLLELDLLLALEVRGELKVLRHDGQLPGSDAGVVLQQRVRDGLLLLLLARVCWEKNTE